MISLAGFPAAAAAHERVDVGGGSGAELPRAVERVIGEDVELRRSGVYEVELPGRDVLTHGPDPRPAPESRPAAVRPGVAGFFAGAAERAPACASDSHYQRFLYAYPAGLYGSAAAAAAALDALRPRLQTEVRRINAVLNKDSLESSGRTADYRVLCDGSGAPRVDAYEVPDDDGDLSFQEIVTAAGGAGYKDPRLDYTIFVDADGACGVGSYYLDESLGALNLSNNPGGELGAAAGYAAVWEPCWFNGTPMHENGHAQGAVQVGAPNGTGNEVADNGGGGHCNDEDDVICYSNDGGERNQTTIEVCADRVHFDCGHDDYFDPAPEPCDYLATHWNLGSTLNRFVRFGPSVPTLQAGLDFGGCPLDPGDADSDDPGDDSGREGSDLVRRLVGGRTLRAAAAAAGDWRHFRVRVGRGIRKLRLTLKGRACDAVPCPSDLDLYVRRAAEPTRSRFACASRGPGARERCGIRRPRRGTWYVGVRTVTGDAAEFGVRAVKRR